LGAGSKGTVPVPVTKIPKVGVALELIVVTIGPVVGMVGFTHWPVIGFVSQSDITSGKITSPVSAEAVMTPLAPTFAVATAKTPVLSTFTIPSFVSVAAKATMSGTGVLETENSKVFNPVLTGAGFVFEQSKLNCTSVGSIGELGVKAKTKL
jgi:hypothetical protein